MNPLLRKKALDALLEGIGDPDYATHQHHSDPDFTTQNGKDYAGRNTTEPETGALKDGIPASLLSVELGKHADVDNPHVTTIPSAPAEVDPSDATFFKESDKMSPAEEKIMSIIAPQGFSYGAHVTDGTTLFFRGSNERLSFDPKTGLVTFSRGGKVALECPINKLKESVSMLKSSAQIFHETLKRELGQDKEAAIRPSPHQVFEDKVDNSTGQQPPAPKNPSDTDVEQAKETLQNAGQPVGDQIGKNASSKWGDKLVKMQARRDPDQIEELGTKMSGFAGGGPFSCMDCIHRTPHSKNAEGVEVDSCKHPAVMDDPELQDRKLPDGTIEVDSDDCCRFVRPTPKKEEKEAAVTKSYGTGTPSGGTPNDPTEDVQDEEDTKTSSAKTAEVGIHETPTMLPPRDDLRRHLDKDVQDEVMEGVMDGVKDAKVADYELDRDEEAVQWLDTVGDMKNEAKAAFMEDPSMQQYVVDAEMTMDELWNETGEEFTENYFASSYAKQGSAGSCPNCGASNGKSVKDGIVSEQDLRECLTCGSFYQR